MIVGTIAFPVTVVVAVVASSTALIFVGGFPSCAAAGYRSEGPLAGVLNGVLVGVAIVVLSVGGVYEAAIASGPVAPGFGISLFLVFLLSVGLAIECTLASALTAVVTRD